MPSAEAPWTILRLLEWTSDFLRKKGSESPRLEAEVLLAHALGCERIQLYTRFAEVVDERTRTKYRELVKRRSDGTPVAYLVGRKEFYSLTFEVTPDVLIPRPDSEFVVVEFEARMKGVANPVGVDVGTGSGCLALACCQQNLNARFHAVDISAAALEVARRNAAKLGLAGRVEFHEGDLLSPVAGLGPFDVVISNPPYIPSAEVDSLDAEVREHEPRGALDGGADGFEVIRRLVVDAAGVLKPGGILLFEIGAGQEAGALEILNAAGSWRVEPTVHDLARIPRVMVARRIEG